MERLVALLEKYSFILTFFCYTFANILIIVRQAGKGRLVPFAAWAAKACLLQGRK